MDRVNIAEVLKKTDRVKQKNLNTIPLYLYNC